MFIVIIIAHLKWKWNTMLCFKQQFKHFKITHLYQNFHFDTENPNFGTCTRNLNFTDTENYCFEDIEELINLISAPQCYKSHVTNGINQHPDHSDVTQIRIWPRKIHSQVVFLPQRNETTTCLTWVSIVNIRLNEFSKFCLVCNSFL